MAQPPPQGPPGVPPTAPPAYPGTPPPGYPPPAYPPPAPRKDNTLVIVLVIVLVVFVVIPAIAAIWFFFIAAPLFPNPTNQPTVTFSTVNPANGNVSFTIASMSQASPEGFFQVNLRVNGVLGSAESIRESPSFSAIPIGGSTYRVYWEDLGNPAYLNSGDGFRVTGDGVPLPSGTYQFYLVWFLNGSASGTASWTV